MYIQAVFIETVSSSLSLSLSIIAEPDIVDAKNSTIQQGRAILSCTVHTNQCRTLLQFFADGVKIEENDERFKRVLVPQNDRDELCGYLIINDVQEEDLNKRYQCMVYANYTTEIPVRSQDLYLIHSPPSTGIIRLIFCAHNVT